MMPKRGCDVSVCEIARFFRLNNNGFCQVIPFTVPRKSELFQEDLYPDTQADVPAITADEWWSGTNSDPILVPMTEQGVQKKVILICFEKFESTWHAIFYIITITVNRYFVRYYFDLQQEDLVVTKKQPNVLDKPKSSQGGGGKPQQNNGAGAATSQDVDVRKLTVRFEKLLI